MKNLFAFIIKFDNNKSFSERGWGNGYVAVPKDHPFYGLHYDEVDRIVDIHGGLTYSGFTSDIIKDSAEVIYGSAADFRKSNDWWVIGFDTAHAFDNPENCNKEFVFTETMNLLLQVEEAK